MKKLAIITPTRNAADYLVECIESVRPEAAPGWAIEHILVDSGSVDGTLDIAERMGVRVEHVDPVTVAHSMNEGISRVDADLIGFLGGDDAMLPGTVGEVAAWYQRRTSDWFTGSTRWIDSHSRSIGVLRAPPRWMTAEIYASLGWSALMMQSTFHTPALWAAVGGYDATYEYAPDYEFFSRCLRFSPFDRTNRVLGAYRIHGNQLSMSLSDDKRAENDSITATYGPPPGAKRSLNRYLMKVWMNGVSPGWFLRKKLPGPTQAIIRRA